MEKKNRNGRKVMAAFLTVSLAVGVLGGCGQTAADTADAKKVEITNVSYDPTRELYEAYNALFADHWKEHLGEYKLWFRPFRFSASRRSRLWMRSSTTGAQGRLLQSI